jgi:hypothetical protein
MRNFTRIITLCTLLCTTPPAFAQGLTLKGRIMSGRNAVDFANVVLLRADSSFVNGCTADKTGSFRLQEVAAGQYLLRISSIGYATRTIALQAFTRSTDLGWLQLDTAAVALGEVTIEASHIINTLDKKIVLPTAFQMKTSTNGLELLKAMHLSHLQINTVQESIKSTMPGEVQLRINDVKADLPQVKALRPEDIVRVEYHDNPSMRYGENVAAVVDYITKRPVSGGYVGMDLRDSPFVAFSDNELNAKFNHKKSELSVYVSHHYRDLYGYWRKNSETFNFDDGTSLTRKEDGTPSRMSETGSPVSLSCNYQEGKKWFFNASFYNYYNFNRTNTKSRLYPENEPDNYTNMRDFVKNRSTRPSLDLYFQRNFGDKQYLIMDVVGTYIHTSDQRSYSETRDGNLLDDIFSKVKGNKYSLIGEAIYGHVFCKYLTLNAGGNIFQAYTKNDYSGTVTATTEMRENRTTAFVEAKGQAGKLSYSVAGRLAHLWTRQADNSYSKNVVYPKIRLGYSFSDKLSLSYSGGLTYNTPSLSNLSNVTQIVDSLQIRRGNPNLKTAHTWSHYLNCEWRKGLFDIEGSLFYMNQIHPVMEETYRENNKFIRTTLNQRSWQKVNPEVTVTFGPIKQFLTLSATGGMNYFDSKGVDYHHCYTNWYCRGSVTANYKNFTLDVEIQSHCNDFYGETLNYGENYHDITLKYKYKSMSFGIAALNPFVGRNSYNRPSENWSRYAPFHNTWYLRESSRLFVGTFTWNIDFGRKYNASQKRINNSDSESGTLTSTK